MNQSASINVIRLKTLLRIALLISSCHGFAKNCSCAIYDVMEPRSGYSMAFCSDEKINRSEMVGTARKQT